MAKKEPKKELKKTSDRINWNEIQWVINNLPQKDLEIVEKMEITHVEINNFLSELIESGFSIKFEWDFYSDCPKLILACYEKGFDNTGYAFSARGADFQHCVSIAMYKYFEVAHGCLNELVESKTSPKYG